jgi:hypothetical protein
MKTKIKALFGLYGFIFLTGLIQGCCKEEFRITSSGNMMAWEISETDNGGIGRKEISEIHGDFILGAYFEEEIASLNNFSFISSSYATSCKETRLNHVDESTFDLSIDKGFILNGDSVQANINLLQLEDSGIVPSVVAGLIEFRFTDEFFSRTILESGNYRFKFRGSTDDNVTLSSDIHLTIN